MTIFPESRFSGKTYFYAIGSRVRRNRDELMEPSMRAIPVLLRCVSLCLNAGEFDTSVSSASNPSISECILQVNLQFTM